MVQAYSLKKKITPINKKKLLLKLLNRWDLSGLNNAALELENVDRKYLPSYVIVSSGL